jgi:hypothetical protein
LGKSTVENVGDVIGSAVGKAWREATEQPNESSPKRSNGASPKRSSGPLSGMRGVIIGAGLGVLAAKKGGPLVKNAVLRYVTSHATGATNEVNVPSTDQAGAGSPGNGTASAGSG